MEITIKGRRYAVNKEGDHYFLRGRRGALYGTVRFRGTPHMMYLVTLGRAFRVDPLGPVVLTDEAGALRWVLEAVAVRT